MPTPRTPPSAREARKPTSFPAHSSENPSQPADQSSCLYRECNPSNENGASLDEGHFARPLDGTHVQRAVDAGLLALVGDVLVGSAYSADGHVAAVALPLSVGAALVVGCRRLGRALVLHRAPHSVLLTDDLELFAERGLDPERGPVGLVGPLGLSRELLARMGRGVRLEVIDDQLRARLDASLAELHNAEVAA